MVVAATAAVATAVAAAAAAAVAVRAVSLSFAHPGTAPSGMCLPICHCHACVKCFAVLCWARLAFMQGPLQARSTHVVFVLLVSQQCACLAG